MQLHHKDDSAGPAGSVDSPDAPWAEVAPLLDEALASLGAKDRDAVLLRFFAKRSFGEIGDALGGNENSARVRVVRALEKLRVYLRNRGIAISALALGGALFGSAVQAAPTGLGAALVKGLGDASVLPGRGEQAALGAALLRHFRWRPWIRFVASLALVLLLLGGGPLATRQYQKARAAEFAASARSLSDTLVAIDRAFMFNDPERFLARLNFRGEDEAFRPVLSNYLRAEFVFRREMQQAFNIQQRTFDLTFRELCVGQPTILTNYIELNRAATNVMTARYPFHLTKVGAAWKWDLFAGWSRPVAEERLEALTRKAQIFERLAREVHDGTATNAIEILEAVRNAP
jgi:hypothetical protein